MKPDLDAIERYAKGTYVPNEPTIMRLVARCRELEAALEPFAQRFEERLEKGIPAFSEDDANAARVLRDES